MSPEQGGGSLYHTVNACQQGGGDGALAHCGIFLRPATSWAANDASLRSHYRPTGGLWQGEWQWPAGASVAPQPASVPLAILLVGSDANQWLLLYHGLHEGTPPPTRRCHVCVCLLIVMLSPLFGLPSPQNTCRYGMWRFVREMVTVAGDWVAERRSRVGPDDPDPEAFSRRSADPSLLRPHHTLVSPGRVTPVTPMVALPGARCC